MPKIRLESGVTIQLGEGATQDDIEEAIAHYQSTLKAQPKAPATAAKQPVTTEQPPQEEEGFFSNLGNAALAGLQSGKAAWDYLAGGLAGAVGAEDASGKLFQQAQQNIEEAQAKRRGGVGGTAGAILGGLATFPVAPVASALERQVNMAKQGASTATGQKAAYGDLLLNSLANIVPGGAGLAGGAVRGAVSNVAADLGSDLLAGEIAKGAGETEAAQQQIRSPQDYLISAALGGAVGGLTGRMTQKAEAAAAMDEPTIETLAAKEAPSAAEAARQESLDAGGNDIIAEARAQEAQKVVTDLPGAPESVGTGATAQLQNDARLITNDVPWEAAKPAVLEMGGPDLPTKAIGALQSRQMATKYGPQVKWGIDQVNLAVGEWRQKIRDLAYGQTVSFDGKVVRGLPSITHAPDAPIPAFKALSTAEKNSLAQVMSDLEREKLPSRATPDELLSRGLGEKQIEVFNKVQDMMGTIWEERKRLLTELGRADEVGPGRYNYLPQKRYGTHQVAAYDKAGELVGYFDFQGKKAAENGKADMLAALEREGLSPDEISFAAPTRITEKYVVPAQEKYFNTSGIHSGTGTKGYFQEKKGVLGGAGSFGKEAGQEALKAIDLYVNRMEKFMTGLEGRKRLTPMWQDKDMATKYPNAMDYITREYDAARGNAGEGIVSKKLDDHIRARLGTSLETLLTGHNIMFNTLKVTAGNMFGYVYNQGLQSLLVGPARGLYLKDQLKLDKSVGLAMGKSIYDLFTGKLSNDQRAGLVYLAKQGLMDQGVAKSVLNFEVDNVKSTGKAMQLLEQFNDKLTRPENFGRAQLFLAFDNLLKDKIKDPTKRWKTAAHQATEAMVDMSPEGRLLMTKEGSRIFAQLYGPLKSFVHNDIGQLVLYTNSVLKKGMSPVERAKAARPLAAFLGARLMAGGLASMVAVKEYDALVNFLNDTWGTDIETSDQLLGDYPAILNRGVPSAALGVDVSSAGSMASITDYPLFPTVSWGAKTYQALKELMSGNEEKGLAQLAKNFGPAMAGRAIEKAYGEKVYEDLKKKGVDSPFGPQIQTTRDTAAVSTDVISPLSLITGKKSLEQAREEKLNLQTSKVQKTFENAKGKLYDELYQAWNNAESGNDKPVQEVVKKLAALHAKYKQELTDEQLEEAITSRMEKEMIPQRIRDMEDENKAVFRMRAEGK